MKATFFLALLLPAASFAETYLCVAEVAALVEDGSGGSAISAQTNADTLTYTLTRENGELVVKTLSDNWMLFDKCERYFCEHSGEYRGIFTMRPGSGNFSIMWLSLNLKDGRERMNVAKGRCSLV